MVIEVRYYKRFDLDLLALIDSGIKLSAYLPMVLQGYAKGEPVKLLVPFCEAHDVDKMQLVHTGIKITDSESIELLKKVRRGYRNSFCKILLRDALVFQSLGIYFTNQDLIKKENNRINLTDTSNIPNLIICRPEKRTKSYAAKILGNNAVKKSKEPINKIENTHEAYVKKVSKPVKQDPEEINKENIVTDPPESFINEESDGSDLLNVFKSMIEGEN